MRKIIVLLIILVLGVGLTGCSDSSTTTENNVVQAPTEESNENVVSNGNEIVVTDALSADKIEVIKEYSIKATSKYTYHFIIFKNNNSMPCEVKTNTKALDSNGELLGIKSASSDVTAPGYEGIIMELFDDVDGVSSYDSTISVSDTYYTEVNSILSMELNATSSKVFVSATNNGNYPAQFVEAYVIFLDSEGNCVDADRGYMTVTDSEIKPGETSSKEFKTRESFATAEVYLSGRYHD